ncbi:tRNA synthetases class I-domain-containing protein [Dunaliella salina]|uniref:isoleucine--tRNA ligase n=1 Tax=Dunaliella salina TaxID=3046 RepID=A0ABQ7GP77_DUNSA|nr:tRNA synthetases class I-domain-containing protein [Dunaliella salina]|eukprot:KAF5836404.1 tRNA synthetases class I-domain-containing protein [Dunaliella salina]
MRANSVVREPQMQAFWAEQRVYEELAANNPGETFTLHDGPPYANGDLHIGHALNKILKDIINKWVAWCCMSMHHQEVGGMMMHDDTSSMYMLPFADAERRGLGPVELRKKAAAFALEAVESQKEQFRRYGIWADWMEPYITLQPSYEAAQLGVFGRMFLNGHIYRGRKPVHWSPSSQTALAEAELEYPEGHKSRSIYTAMPLESLGPNVTPEHAQHLQGAGVAIWTTTPWTIPANLAVAINDQMEYCVVEARGEAANSWVCKKLVVAKGLVEALQEKFGVTLHILSSFKGSVLDGCHYRHPLADRLSPVVVGGDYITTDAGTGLVHTAPGHGQEDYQVGQRYGLPLLSPVDDKGVFTAEAGPEFEGKAVQGEGNEAVVKALTGAGALLKEEMYSHKYPYDWRTKKPTIFRATSQWFASVNGFKEGALDAIKQVSWVPAAGQARITAMTDSRSDWCISRQRKWGVPIPVFYDLETDEAVMTEESISHVANLFSQHGSDIWWTAPLEQLLPPSLAHLAPRLKKGDDTMDVWFDSGSSWAGVLRTNPKLNFPADLYLEGSDQHRGWFQSSLLTSVAAYGSAPYKQVLTHGFVLDEKGSKMSKSLGNVVDPRMVIQGGKDERKEPPYGADVLRLWVASVDYTSDVMIGPGIIKQVSDIYRKMRGTLRFVLGNLDGFDPKVHAVPYASLPGLDRFMLRRLAALQTEVAAAYKVHAFSRIYSMLQRFVAQDCSNFYLDIAKDRLYIRGESDAARRSCQTVCYALLRGLLADLAPLTPHMAEDAWQCMGSALRDGMASVFQAGGAAAEPEWTQMPEAEFQAWAKLLAVRDGVNGALEQARGAKAIGSSLDARVLLHSTEPGLAATLQGLQQAGNSVDELKYLFIVSQAEVVGTASAAQQAPYSEVVPAATATTSQGMGGSNNGPELGGDVTVGVERARGRKCSRCWNYSETIGTHTSHPELCERCTPIVLNMNFVPKPAMETAAA